MFIEVWTQWVSCKVIDALHKGKKFGQKNVFMVILFLFYTKQWNQCISLKNKSSIIHKWIDIVSITPRALIRQRKQMTSNSNIWRHLLGLRYATLHATSSWGQLQSPILFYLYTKPFSRCKLCLHQYYIHQTRWTKGNGREMIRKTLFFKRSAFRYCPEKYKIKKEVLFSVNTIIFHRIRYWKYHQFHSCYALVKMLLFSTHSMKYIWYSTKKR